MGSDRRRLRYFFAACAAIFLVYTYCNGFERHGDGFEYVYTTEAFYDHGTPFITPDEHRDISGVFRSRNLPAPYAPETFTTLQGRELVLHFWMYSLTVVPLKLLLRLTGLNTTVAFQLTNALFLIGACAFGMFWRTRVDRRRFWFVPLAAVGPAIWYVHWPSPEVFCWATVVCALVLLEEEKYVLAALVSAFGATQNPPIVFLAVAAATLSIRRKQYRASLAAFGACAIATLPYAFWYSQYHKPSLILLGATDKSNVSFARTWSVLADLNQGMLPYAPLLLLLAPVAMVLMIRARDVTSIGVSCAAALFVLGCEPATNWNPGEAGVLRYVVWMIPLFAWLIARHLGDLRWAQPALAAAAVLQVLVVAWQYDGREEYLSHNFIADFVLRRAPRLYSPEPEIFAERTLHGEFYYAEQLPIAYSDGDGVVTKILTNRPAMGWFERRFDMDPEGMADLLRQAPAQERPALAVPPLFYLHPKYGTVRDPAPEMRFLRGTSCAAIGPAPACGATCELQVFNGRAVGHDVEVYVTVSMAPPGSLTLHADGMEPQTHANVGAEPIELREHVFVNGKNGIMLRIDCAPTTPATGPAAGTFRVHEIALGKPSRAQDG